MEPMEVTVDCPLEIVSYLQQLAPSQGRLPRSALHIQLVESQSIRMFYMPKRNHLQLDLLLR